MTDDANFCIVFIGQAVIFCTIQFEKGGFHLVVAMRGGL